MKLMSLCLLCCVGLAASADARPDPKINVHIRTIATGDDFFLPYGINDHGDVVGTIGDTPNTRAVRWTSDGGVEDLGAFGSAGAFGFGINNSGQLAIGGFRTPGTTWETAARWTPGDGPELIPTPGGADALARGINDQGAIVGMVMEDVGGGVMRSRAMRYTDGLGVEALQPLGDDVRGWGVGINNHGVVTGWSGTSTELRAFVGSPESGSIDLIAFDSRFRIGIAINDHGQVAGNGNEGSMPIWMLYTPGEGVISPGEGSAHSINNLGHVVGVVPRDMPTLPNVTTPFFWSEKTGQIVLESLLPADSGWELYQAWGINDFGEIVGSGRLDGVDTTFILTIPAPGSGCILVALGLLAAHRRR